MSDATLLCVVQTSALSVLAIDQQMAEVTMEIEGLEIKYQELGNNKARHGGIPGCSLLCSVHQQLCRSGSCDVIYCAPDWSNMYLVCLDRRMSFHRHYIMHRCCTVTCVRLVKTPDAC